jgi:hypothetical protein
MWGGRESTGGGAAPEAHAGRRRPAGVAYVGCRRRRETLPERLRERFAAFEPAPAGEGG